MIQIDETTNSVMQALLPKGEILILVWPKDASLGQLQQVKELVLFQLNALIKSKSRKATT